MCVYHGTLADLSPSTMQEAGKRPNKKLPMGIVMGELDRRETVFFSFFFFQERWSTARQSCSNESRFMNASSEESLLLAVTLCNWYLCYLK